MLPRLCQFRWITAVGAAAWVCALGLGLRPTAAQNWPAADGLDVQTIVALTPDRTLTPALQSQLQTATREALTRLLGKAPTVAALSPAAERWLAAHPVRDLTPADVRPWGWEQRGKTVVVVLERRRGAYVISAGEYDTLFDTLQWLPEALVVQRELLPDVAGRLAAAAWQPIGEVQAAQEATVEVRYRLPPAAQSLLPESGAILRVCSQWRMPEGLKTTLRRDQFLVTTASDAAAAGGPLITAELKKLPRLSSCLARFGHPQVRFLVQPVPLTTDRGAVEVRLRKTGRPREGCEVFVSTTPPTSDATLGTSLGLTDRAGRIALPQEVGALRYVSVRFADLWDTQLFVPGAQRGPLRFELDSPEERLELSLQVEQVKQEIEHRRRQLVRLAEELTAARANRDVPAALRLQQEAEPFLVYDDLEYRLEKLRSWLELGRGDPSGKVAQSIAALLEQLQKLQAQDETGARVQYANAVLGTKIADLNERFQLATAAKDWQKAGPLLRELAALQPQEDRVQKLWKAYQAASTLKSPAHAQARQTVEATNPQTMGELRAQWPRLKQAIAQLIADEDRLTLDTLTPRFDAWNSLVEGELRRIKAVSTSALPQGEAAALTALLGEVQAIANENVGLMEQKDKLLSQGVLLEASARDANAPSAN